MKTVEIREKFKKAKSIGFMIGLAGLAVMIFGFIRWPDQAYKSFLYGYLCWIGLSLGCLGILMIHHLTGGNWGFVTRRLFEAGAKSFPMMALLFLPIVLGLNHIYEWTHPGEDHHILRLRSYLNSNFFTIRAALYFLIWSGLGFALTYFSHKHDISDDPRDMRKLKVISALGLVVFFLTATFALVDWGMSLEPHWFSTIYGLIHLTGYGLSALAGALVISALIRNEDDLKLIATDKSFYDLGNLTMAFVMLWAYMSFSQYIIIWSANLTEEIPWYINRSRGGWQWLLLLLAVFQLALPFLLLLNRTVKRRVIWLAGVCALIFVMRFAEMFWLLMPAFFPNGFHIHFFDAAAVTSIGALWAAHFAWILPTRPLIPRLDEHLLETSHG